MTPKISLIIVNYKSEDALEHCLRSIHIATNQRTEIILVDNLPGHGADDLLKKSGLVSHYFPQTENIGYTRAANFGAQHASGEYLCFLNPDTVLGAHMLDRLLAWVEHHPRSVVGPRELNARGQVITSAFPFVTRRSVWGATLLYKLPWPKSWQPWLSWLIPSYHYARLCQSATRPNQVPVVSGSCLFLRRQTWDEVGEWNEQLTYFGLESEWFRRARELGIVAWYVPEATMFHEHAVSIHRSHGWRIREEADANRRWHAATFGIVTAGVLGLLLVVERFFRRINKS